MGVHDTSQASGYGLTQRMIAGSSLGAALAAALYNETRRKHHQATHDVTNSSRFTVEGPLIDEPPPQQQNNHRIYYFWFQLINFRGCKHFVLSPPVFVACFQQS